MGTVDILSRLRAKKSSDGQSKPPYPQSNPANHSLDAQGYHNVSVGDPPNLLGSLAGVMGTPDMWAHVNRSEVEAELLRQMNYSQAQAQVNALHGAQQASLPAPVMTPPNRPATGKDLSARAREMFLKRMGGIRQELKIAEEDYLHCHIFGETVYLFYCFNGRDGCAKEDIGLFPSDQLITQFRMVLST